MTLKKNTINKILIFATIFAVGACALTMNNAQADDGLVIKCDNTVDRGVIILDNPPIMNCKDMDLVQMFVGSGLVLGPVANVEALAAQLDEMAKQEQKTDPKEEFEARKEKAFDEI